MERIGQKNVGRGSELQPNKLRKGKKVEGQPSFGLWATNCLYHHHGRISFATEQWPSLQLGTKNTDKSKNRTREIFQTLIGKNTCFMAMLSKTMQSNILFFHCRSRESTEP